MLVINEIKFTSVSVLTSHGGVTKVQLCSSLSEIALTKTCTRLTDELKIELD